MIPAGILPVANDKTSFTDVSADEKSLTRLGGKTLIRSGALEAGAPY